MGNAATPSPKLLTGEEGTKQLVAVKQEGEQGLAVFFEKEKAAAVLGEGGLPPGVPSVGRIPGVNAEKYTIPPKDQQAYSEDYSCRVFV